MISSKRGYLCARLSLVIFLAGSHAHAQSGKGHGILQAKQTVNSQMLPGGVADAEAKVGYLADVGGGVKAVDLSTGHTLWTSKTASKPLLLTGNRLIAVLPDSQKSNVLRIAALDTAHSGRTLRLSEAVVFPDWMDVEGSHGLRLLMRVSVEKETVILDWQASSSYAGGARPTPELLKRMSHLETGHFAMSLLDGKVKRSSPPRVPVWFEPVGNTVILGSRQYTRVDKAIQLTRDGMTIPNSLIATDHNTSTKLWEIPIAGRRYDAPLP